MATIANQRWISIRNIIIYLETKFLPNRRIFVFWWPFWIQNGHYRNTTMDINSQHHNLLGNQISSDVTNWYPLAAKIQKSSDLEEIWFPSRLWCYELISIVGLLWWPFWIQNSHQNTKILHFGGHFGFKMAAIANQRWISIHNIIIYLETKFRPNRRIFV
jgi:hypothetical protein